MPMISAVEAKYDDKSAESADPLSTHAVSSPLVVRSHNGDSEVEPAKGSVAVVLASANRPKLLAEAIRTCADQRDLSCQGVLSVPDQASLPDDPALLAGWQIVLGT